MKRWIFWKGVHALSHDEYVISNRASTKDAVSFMYWASPGQNLDNSVITIGNTLKPLRMTIMPSPPQTTMDEVDAQKVQRDIWAGVDEVTDVCHLQNPQLVSSQL